MSAPGRGLLDTSAFIAEKSGRGLAVEKFPEELAISVITLGALQAGVLAAEDPNVRAARLATLAVGSDMLALPVDDRVALQWARLRVLLGKSARRVKVNASWIAATALVHGASVVTQDDDFDVMADVVGLNVVRV